MLAEKQIEMTSRERQEFTSVSVVNENLVKSADTLILAASLNRADEVKRLVQSQGLDVNAQNIDGRTAMHAAACRGLPEMIETLCTLNASINVKDRQDMTPLDCAIKERQDVAVKMLIQKNASLGSSYTSQRNLFDAVDQDDQKTCAFLLQAGVQANCMDHDLRTPLHLACLKKRVKCAEYLLNARASINLCDRFGRTPESIVSSIALRSPQDDIVRLFENFRDAKDNHGGHQQQHHHHHKSNRFIWFFVLAEIALIVLHCVLTKYGPGAEGNVENNEEKQVEVNNKYALFQDVHIMIFIGFGFLMVFLRRHMYSSLGYTFLVSALCIQWYLLCIAFWSNTIQGQAGWHAPFVNIEMFIRSDFAAGAVMITFGVVLGKVSAFQIMFIAVWEIIFFSLNEEISLYMGISDLGGSMVIHMFGAFFGLACSFVITPPEAGNAEKAKHNAPVYHSDMMAMIGTIFLWAFWPSFNGALGSGATMHRAISNTILSLTGSCVSAFLCSYWFRGESKFSMEDVQNATLAGGVAMGTCADLVIEPGFAILIGVLAGVVSVWGYVVLKKLLERKIGLYDTCGVLNLHGMPSLIGAFAGVIASAEAGLGSYHISQLGQSFFERVNDEHVIVREAEDQALKQLAFIFITLGIALSSGWLVGLIARNPFFEPLSPNQLFTDDAQWETPAQETPFYFDPAADETNALTEPLSKLEKKVGSAYTHLSSRLDNWEAKLSVLSVFDQLVQRTHLIDSPAKQMLSSASSSSSYDASAKLV
eukprot:TRINITY_DN107_c0_g1_i1.p1 TRINITY_DN107_c0_g1~~TRINITY_DN107_c0_g1_i1.p1  ORF type:complete len:762 (+),score=204.89 TRINITY_DN107_c0_g1_i1:23-2308(+)